MLDAVVAAVPLAVGAALELWALFALGWRRTLDLTAAPPEPGLPRLVLGGPFRYVRHPQSLGLLLLLAGAAVGIRSAGMWVVAGLAGALVTSMAVRHDRELARELGEAYARYRDAVPLLVPRLR
jgi:protein-S-isoprenylcysteine O-methyltransferase Ste14